MTRLTDLDEAVRAAVDPLTREERAVFTAEMSRLFPAGSTTATDQDVARDRAWHLACSKLLSDPLDPIGEAWSRFAGTLFES
jgi:hypothetical protein